MTAPALTLLDVDGREHVLPGDTEAVDGAALAEATGWVLKPEGLCRGETCVPLLGRAVEREDGRIDLVEWAAALGLALAVDDRARHRRPGPLGPRHRHPRAPRRPS